MRPEPTEALFLVASDASGAASGGLSTFQLTGSGAARPVGHVSMPEPLAMAFHPELPWVYASSAARGGELHAFRRRPDGALETVTVVDSGGARPCDICVDPSGSYLLSANYGSGTVSVSRIEKTGDLGERTSVLALPVPSEPDDPDRQDASHPHQVVFDPAGRFLHVCDLGTDRVYAFELDLDRGWLRPAPVPHSATPPGWGPRNLVFSAENPGDVHLAAELGSSVSRFASDEASGGLTLRALRALGAPAPSRAVGPAPATQAVGPVPARNYPGALVTFGDRVAYVANRGGNTIATVVLPLTNTSPITETPVGDWPQDMDVVGETLVVAARDSGSVLLYEIDPSTGRLADEPARVECPRPTTVMYLPLRTEPGTATRRQRAG